MRAHAELVAEPDGRGGTRLARLRGEAPLLLRQTPTHPGSGTPRAATVHLVGGAASPLGGDELHLSIEVRPGAALRLHTVAASVALPGPGGTPSRSVVTARVGGGAALWYLPEQLVAGAGCRHEAVSTVELEEGAALVWRDELVCGRHAEAPGAASVSLHATYAGRALLRQCLTVGPGTPGWSGAGVLGDARATGSLLHIDATCPHRQPQVIAGTAVRVPLAGPGCLITATAADTHRLRDYLTPH
jgi:urease accessory protein